MMVYSNTPHIAVQEKTSRDGADISLGGLVVNTFCKGCKKEVHVYLGNFFISTGIPFVACVGAGEALD